MKMSEKTRLILGNHELGLKGKYVHCTRILSGIMKVTTRQSRNNEFQLSQEEVDSYGRYAMFIPYISTVYMKMGIQRKCIGIC